jgi:hypothetical protein
VIRSILGRIPPHLGDQTRVEVEAELARHARTLDAGQLETLGKRILGYLDQGGRRPHDTPDTYRHLRLRDRDGGCELVGWLDREAPEIVRAALSPLAAPAQPTPRSTGAPPPNATPTPWSTSPKGHCRLVTCPPKAGNAPRSWSP